MKGSAEGITDRRQEVIAVLTSGGLDSCILLVEMLGVHPGVYPIYIRGGLSWEVAELSALRRFLLRISGPGLEPLQLLDLPVRDLYGRHWSVTGDGVPAADSPDAAVFLPGRNVLLLAKGMLWCHLHHVPAIALAILEANPFPDATPGFFRAYQDVVNQAVDGSVRIERPYAGLHKAELMRRGRGLPLELTFSCIHPVEGRHCGRCNKCAERRRAFAQGGLPDLTDYAAEPSCTA